MLHNAPPPATRDSLPPERAMRRCLEARFVENARAYGFEEVATPMFERADLFAARSGPEIKGSLLTFHCDHEEYALRPEMTAPICRMVASGALDGLPHPYKLCYVAPCFRYCRPHSGRTREFTQAGVELLGDSSPSADAEIIAAAHRFLRRVGIDRLRLKIGTAGIFRALLPPDRTSEDRAAVIGHLDRLAGITERCSVFTRSQEPLLLEQMRADRREMAALQAEVGYGGEYSIANHPSAEPESLADRLPDEAAATFRHLWNVEGYVPDETADIMLNTIGIRGTPHEVSAHASETLAGSSAETALENLMTVCSRLEHYGIGEFDVALGIARGLTFYTGTVFEIASGQTKLCGGGRYDRLVELFGGEPTPATGCAVRFDTLQDIARIDGRQPASDPIFIKPASPADEPAAVRLAETLRNGGRNVGAPGAEVWTVASGTVRLPDGVEIELADAAAKACGGSELA